jgi:hypothetical protein
LKIPVFITTVHGAWDYVINRIGFTATMLACVSVTLKNALSNLAPLGC